MKPFKSVKIISVDTTFRIDHNLLIGWEEPVVIRGYDLGRCLSCWTPEYLECKGVNKIVKVHRSSQPKLDFRNKNFTYETITFPELVRYCSDRTSEISSDELVHKVENSPGLKFLDTKKNPDLVSDPVVYWYLRSLGEDPRGKDVSDLAKHFPELYEDISIPPVFSPESFFSSVFRITSPRLQLWTHYDTCHNILIQIKGRKRVVFYPPSEALNLYLDGDKSQVLDIDNPDIEKYPKFLSIERYEVFLEEGDIVFIPALWFHNVTALEFSISVNVFWKNLSLDLYDKKDTYGNRDLIPAQLSFTSGQFTFTTRAPDNNTCTGVVSNLFRRQLRRILLCQRQLNLRTGHHCVLKCAMIMEGVLSKEGKIEQKLLDQFVEKFPLFMQQRVIQYIERCRAVSVGKVDPKEDSCKSYEPLSRCVMDAVFNGFRTLDKAAIQLKNLPCSYEDFYLRRMIISLENRLNKLREDKTPENDNQN